MQDVRGRRVSDLLEIRHRYSAGSSSSRVLIVFGCLISSPRVSSGAGRQRGVVQVGDDQRCAADLRRGRRDRLAGQHFVDAGHEPLFARLDVLARRAPSGTSAPGSSRVAVCSRSSAAALVGERALFVVTIGSVRSYAAPIGRAAARRSTCRRSQRCRSLFFARRPPHDAHAVQLELRAIFDLQAAAAVDLPSRIAPSSVNICSLWTMPVEFDEIGRPASRTLSYRWKSTFCSPCPRSIWNSALGGKRRGQRRQVRELQVVRRGERRVEGRVARQVGARMIGLLLQQADLGLSAHEADVELGLVDDDQRADDGDERRGDPGPFDPPIVWNTSQLSGTSATRYTARQITTNAAPGTSTPAASRSASRAALAVALKSFHAPMPPALAGGRYSRDRLLADWLN